MALKIQTTASHQTTIVSDSRSLRLPLRPPQSEGIKFEASVSDVRTHPQNNTEQEPSTCKQQPTRQIKITWHNHDRIEVHKFQ
uniref:Uncharacterized protein MANES_17G100900 n=1 Tax=Rhizophora mucronata TaxID=61149 RepID=A0A2P2LY31_RHIMU